MSRIQFILIILLAFSLGELKAQQSTYLEWRSGLLKENSKAFGDSLIPETHMRVASFSPDSMDDANRAVWHEDMGWCLYRNFLRNHRKAEANQAIQHFQQAIWFDPEFSTAYWNAALCYYALNDCENMAGMLEGYRSHTKKRRWDKPQMRYLHERCHLPIEGF
jgi:tetratricopeptide (TPR) repeat protein